MNEFLMFFNSIKRYQKDQMTCEPERICFLCILISCINKTSQFRFNIGGLGPTALKLCLIKTYLFSIHLQGMASNKLTTAQHLPLHSYVTEFIC